MRRVQIATFSELEKSAACSRTSVFSLAPASINSAVSAPIANRTYCSINLFSQLIDSTPLSLSE